MSNDLFERLEELGADPDDALERIGDREKLERLLHDFAADELLESIQTALEKDNGEEAEKLAHTLKGIAFGLGLLPVADAAMDMQLGCRDGGAAEGRPLLPALHEAVQAVRDIVRNSAQTS